MKRDLAARKMSTALGYAARPAWLPWGFVPTMRLMRGGRP